jgi:hypothetical protein
MRVSKLASAAAVAVMLAAAPVLLSASDSDKDKTASKPAPASTVASESVPASRLATLKAVKAAPMSSSELDAVKGQHAHFWNPGAPFPTSEPHVVNSNNLDNWLDLGNGEIVGPGYHGLCKALAVGSAIFINPGGGC